MKKILNQHTPFWLLTFSILIGLTLPTLIKDGMFMDGMLYTSVSHNLSMGIGTFWFPQFSLHNVAGLSSFHEQPPLVFGIQSLFYKLLGDSMYVERFYTFFAMCITAMLVIFLWNKIFKNQADIKKIGWLPLIMWITIPVCFWSYSNNMHENTMGIFTLCSVLLTYISFHSTKNQIILLSLSGISIFLASLSKGFPGLFPVGLPFLYWLTTKKIHFSKAFFQTFVITFIPLLIYTFLFFIPESKQSLSIYFFERALHRMNEVPTVDNRFYIIGHLFMELIPQFILVGIFIVIAKTKKVTLLASPQINEAVFFIFIGLSATVPLMLTLVQKGFYFVPALPFFAIGLSIVIVPIILKLIEKIDMKNKKFNLFLLISSFLLIVVIAFSFMQKGKFSRNEELLHDVYLIGKVTPKQSIVSIPPEIWNEWDLQCYLIRYFNISLDVSEKNDYFLNEKTTSKTIPLGYKKIMISTLKYDLYKRQ